MGAGGEGGAGPGGPAESTGGGGLEGRAESCPPTPSARPNQRRVAIKGAALRLMVAAS